MAWRGRAQCGGEHTSSSSPSLPSPSPSLPSPSLPSPSLPSPSLPSSSAGGGAAQFVGSRAHPAERIVAASFELRKDKGAAGRGRARGPFLGAGCVG